jgi:hypothetical protein
MAKARKSSWIVRVRKTVKTELICENCTEEQAKDNPYEYLVDEMEQDTEDYEVLSVKENI